MRRKFRSKHNFWGGVDGPPGPIPFIDPEDVWLEDSLKYACCLRLTAEELRVVHEAIGREPLGRYGDYPNGSDYFWAFPTEQEQREAMERETDAMATLRQQSACSNPKNTSERPSIIESNQSNGTAENPAKNYDGYQYPELQGLNDDELEKLATERGVSFTDLLFTRLCDGP